MSATYDAPVGQKNEIVAALLSFFLPGVGQIYAGQTKKGIAIIAVSLFTCNLFGFGSFVFAFDAYTIAGRVNRGELLTDFQMF